MQRLKKKQIRNQDMNGLKIIIVLLKIRKKNWKKLKEKLREKSKDFDDLKDKIGEFDFSRKAMRKSRKAMRKRILIVLKTIDLMI